MRSSRSPASRPARPPPPAEPAPVERSLRSPALTPLVYRHQKVQRLRRLVGRRSARQAEHTFVVEGTKVLREALVAGVPVESIYVEPGLAGAGDPLELVLRDAHATGTRVYELAPGVLARVADTVSPQPVMAIVRQIDVSLEALGASRPDLVVVCAGVRDPGNAGTILRSAQAAGAGAVICCEGSVDPFNPKTVRASAGALFHVPVVAGGPASDVLAAVGRWGLARLGTRAKGGAEYTSVDLTGPTALVLGNEAHGLADGLDDQLDGEITIPMTGAAESLNVGMAAAVLCFEAARQRRQGALDTGALPQPAS